MLRHIGLCVAIMAMLLLASVAAKANDLPPPDPADMAYTITLEPSLKNTARCLGDLSTALCALETFIACEEIPEMRVNPVCAKAGYKLPPPLTGEFKRMEEARPKDTTVYRMAVFYRIHSSFWPSPEMVTQIKRYTRHGAYQELEKDHWIELNDAIVLVQQGRCISRMEQECHARPSSYVMHAIYKKGAA